MSTVGMDNFKLPYVTKRLKIKFSRRAVNEEFRARVCKNRSKNKVVVRKCVICKVNEAILNTYGSLACLYCLDFFYDCVSNLVVSQCIKNGNCPRLPDDCNFCKLNRCYDAGMKAQLIDCGETYSILRSIRFTQSPRGIRFLKKRDKKQLFECIPCLRDMFLNTIFSMEQFTCLPITRKQFLLSKAMIRGIIMELVEMCLQVHNVLRLKTSFVDPHVSRSEFVRDFGINVLRLTEAIRTNKNNGIFSFYNIKLFLIFQRSKYKFVLLYAFLNIKNIYFFYIISFRNLFP
ncbi:uncharacterized protein LOC111618689 [Centruroides sculpturatus]|uniref:uncharacterized protein LOC111618689 n=1 Tax=Centruroides sculpturatus TaxID=218467 RepID=UPI000C6E1BE7|nr:uncharacterized protein LOC111618689 [Centruroides sculpturatus]